MSPLKDPTLAAQIVFGLVILIIALHLALPKFVNNSFHIIPVPPYTTKNGGFGPRFFGPRFKKRGPKMPNAPFFKNGA